MVRNVVVVPGIFGTTMLRGGDAFELWPPIGQAEPMDPYTRATELIAATTVAGVLLEGVPLLPALSIPEYSPLTAFVDSLPATALVRFGYDWRVDLRVSAAVLADRLDMLEGPIVLLAHSMGGLVCRYLLESGEFDGAAWFGRVTQLVCIATPHLGAPLAVFRLLGMEGLSGFIFPGAAMGILGSVPQTYPAGHQLLPPETMDCVTLANGVHANVGTAFAAIPAAGLAAASGLHAVLEAYRRPSHVLYRFAFGHGHVDGAGLRDTTAGITIDPRGRVGHLMGDGDGTVPFWSALPSGPAGFVDDQFGLVGEHVGMLGDATLLQRLEDWMSPRIA